MGEHRQEDATPPNGEALHAHAVTEEYARRLDRRALVIQNRQQVDKRAATARVDEHDHRGIGGGVTVEVAESHQVSCQSGTYLLRRALAVPDGALPLLEANRGFLVAA